ncbi:Adenylate isopentenyltransferase [Melia azedarach]|uniref:Adenylate isopentenyltransferase n=1 Tax=Melia azedarach TaxID=155640 RepID=A0ACC1XYP3_MELAZ|nr:Adenylate isopentenyltransferase [Melia azedarach]
MNFSSGVHYSNDKTKVVFIMGATGTGKTKLSIDLATHFSGEIINSDKIQVFKGLDIASNKITESERRDIPHHLLGVLDPDADFTAEDFCHHTLRAIDKIIENGHLPIIVGGSNTYIEALVEDPMIKFTTKFDCCFLWMDVSLPVLYKYVGKRVDQMVGAGLVDETRKMFVPGADYSRGIRRAIGAPELDYYFQVEQQLEDDEIGRKMLLEDAIQEVKDNTCKLVNKQLEKIKRLRNEVGWDIHRIDATHVFESSGKEAKDAWEEVVLKPSLVIVDDFLKGCKREISREEAFPISWLNFLRNLLLPVARRMKEMIRV